MKTTTLALTVALALGLVACTKKSPKPDHDGVGEPPPAPMAKATSPGAPSMRTAPVRPVPPRPGQCAGGLLAPELKCSATATVATCRLTDPCMGTLKVPKASDATLTTLHGKQLGNLKLTADGRGLTLAHKLPAGAALRIDLSFDIRNVPFNSPYSRGHKASRLAGVKNARKMPHSYLVSLHVPSKHKAKPVLIVPRKSIGPVKLGMTRAALGKLGLKVRPHPSGHFGNNVVLAGPYYIVLDKKNRVDSIELNLSESAAGLKLGKRFVGPGATPAAVAKAMPGCGKLVEATGGSTYTCDGGRLLVKMGGPYSPPIVQVQIFAKPVR